MKAEIIAKALGGRKAGAAWMARCPAHDDRVPSLSISDADGKVLVRCHAGCDQRDVIAALCSRGIWETEGRQQGRSPRQNGRQPVGEPAQDAFKRTEAALGLWQATQPADGTLVETYLRSRGLSVAPPATLRFHARLKHPTGGIWPAMVALVARGEDDRPLSIHRSFFARDGVGKAGRSREDDAPALSRRRGAPRLTRRCADGRRRYRDLPRRHASDRTTGIGRTLDIGAAHARSARRSAQRDRACRWRRARRGGCARLRLALEAGGPARAHRPPAAEDGFQ
jgi:hypothetical protein